MHFMIDCRIEVEAPDLATAEHIADGIDHAFVNLADGLDGNPVMFVDEVRPTEGESS